MPYTAHVFNVMIAAPSDIAEEPRIVREAIAECNAVYAEKQRVVLMPLNWEDDSIPGTGSQPQKIINKQLLQRADLLIAIFWTRLGSPTEQFLSGTVEEIEKHIELGKQAMIYFSSAPVRPDSIDSGQYAKLKDFKASLKNRSLFRGYSDVNDFRFKISKHLNQKVISDFSSQVDSAVQKTRPSGSHQAIDAFDRAHRHEADQVERQGEATLRTYPPPRRAPAMTEAAQELLIEATRDSSGAILVAETFGGCTIQTNNKNFVEEGSARSEARWRQAVKDLLRSDLVEDRSGKGEVFFVTDHGYTVAAYALKG